MTSWTGSVSLPVRVLATATGKLGAFSAVTVAETVSVAVSGSGVSLSPAIPGTLSVSSASVASLTLTPVSPTSLSF